MAVLIEQVVNGLKETIKNQATKVLGNCSFVLFAKEK